MRSTSPNLLFLILWYFISVSTAINVPYFNPEQYAMSILFFKDQGFSLIAKNSQLDTGPCTIYVKITVTPNRDTLKSNVSNFISSCRKKLGQPNGVITTYEMSSEDYDTIIKDKNLVENAFVLLRSEKPLKKGYNYKLEYYLKTCYNSIIIERKFQMRYKLTEAENREWVPYVIKDAKNQTVISWSQEIEHSEFSHKWKIVP